MSRWFRFYDDVIHDAKILKLSDEMFRVWVTFLCLASKGEGQLPPPADIAATLRERPAKIAAWIAGLRAAGLLDEIDGGYRPHNWGGRQFQSDVSNERVKRHRQRKRNVTSAVTVTPPDAETDTDDRIGSARASKFTDGSKALASAFWKALGFANPLSIPPEFAGVDWRAVDWEAAGWTVDLIETEARRIGPDKPLSYHEKVFATAFAKRQAPLPTVQIRQADPIQVTHGTSQNRSGGSLIAAIDRELATIEAEERADLALPESPVLRISN